jgi:hypothetical protein
VSKGPVKRDDVCGRRGQDFGNASNRMRERETQIKRNSERDGPKCSPAYLSSDDLLLRYKYVVCVLVWFCSDFIFFTRGV